MSNKSTGPRTVEGKARSSQNALKTGIYSHSQIIPGEDPADHEKLTGEYYLRYQPFSPAQRDLLDRVIHSAWMLRRFSRVSTQIWLYKLPDLFKPNPTSQLGQAFLAVGNHFGRLQRLINSTQRNFDLALAELDRLQTAESSLPLPPDPPPAPSTETPQPEESTTVTPPTQFVPSTPMRVKSGIHRYEGHDRFLDQNEQRTLSECPHCFPENLEPHRSA